MIEVSLLSDKSKFKKYGEVGNVSTNQIFCKSFSTLFFLLVKRFCYDS